MARGVVLHKRMKSLAVDCAVIIGGIVPSIGRFQVSPGVREIRLDGRIVQIEGRAYDLLEMLILARGALVTKEQILDSVWPRSIVEDNNVHVHMTAVRKTLGKNRDLIKTVSGRGYHLMISSSATSGSVDCLDDDHPGTLGLCNHNLPVHASPLIGRTGAIEKVKELLASSQLVTLVGAGGIGKTRLAIEVGRSLRTRFPDGVLFVPLGGVMDASLVFGALTAALAIKTTDKMISFRRVAERIDGKKIMIVLDNCEHVLKSVPEIAERLMRANSEIHILATSREPLSVTDECIYCVPPLDIPRVGDFSEESVHASAVDLFTARARAANPRYSMDPETLRLTMAVCRRLDGIPLAIELAAARAAVFGIQVVAANMADPFGVLADGCRTASPRQRTFRATLDWSYRTLNENERVVLRGVSIFKTPFTFHAACDAVGASHLNQKQIMDAFGGLVSKSLVVQDDDALCVKYRLFEVIRAYAFEKRNEGASRAAVEGVQALSFDRLAS